MTEDHAASLAVVGAGAVGGTVCRSVHAGSVRGVDLLGVLTRTQERRLPDGVPRFRDIDALLAQAPTVVVEAASHGAVRAYAPCILQTGATLICTSVGALADLSLLGRIEAIAAESGGRIIIPSGAIGGLDMLRAAACDGLESVDVEQRKPPSALLASEDAERVTVPTTIFAGPVADAIRMFPTTTNILAAVALAGIGPARTHVSIVADPTVDANHASVKATGAFGSFEFRVSNRKSDNPRTSAVTALSVVATLKNLCGVTKVPG